MNNYISIIGRFTKDLELRSTSSGKSVVEFNLAVNRTLKNKDGEYETDFIPVTIWGKTAETITKYCKKGDLIGVAGELRIDKYKDKDGNDRYKTYVLGNNATFLSPKPKEETPMEEFNPSYKTEYQEKDVILSDEDLPF